MFVPPSWIECLQRGWEAVRQGPAPSWTRPAQERAEWGQGNSPAPPSDVQGSLCPCRHCPWPRAGQSPLWPSESLLRNGGVGPDRLRGPSAEPGCWVGHSRPHVHWWACGCQSRRKGVLSVERAPEAGNVAGETQTGLFFTREAPGCLQRRLWGRQATVFLTIWDFCAT